ncbi:MAG TPA: tRNA (N6-threonylcarbamoyladenosine(37)-N6)-methyltransferase TrmO [Bacteroidota bacterium]|nr:tRNA (N6-threonylcarbamoyladenosine(37)-N6)-methyltransferase TrmO [Bacteroidota bacterium]
MSAPSLVLKPIGIVRTPFNSKYDAPRQPATAQEESVGVITLEAGMNFEQALEDLNGFDYVWVLFWFHKNTNWKPKVLPPHGNRLKRGVFATRSPHRPNAIGLSLCKLLGVRGRTIRIGNPDMLDGTPVLDIKPYIPHAESHANARGGWIQDSHEQSTPAFAVSFSPAVREAFDEMNNETARELSGYLTAILSHDPHPHVYRRIKAQPDGTSVIAVKRWRFTYEVRDNTVRVLGISRSTARKVQR